MVSVPSPELAKEAVAALIRFGGNQTAAAKEIGIHRTSIKDRLRGAVKLGIEIPFPEIVALAKRELAQRGWAPDHDLTHEVPDGLTLKGTSIKYDGSGNIKDYWNKTKQQGLDPDEAIQLPDPKTITKLSTLTDQTGHVILQWKAEKPEDLAREAAWTELAEHLCAGLPAVPEIPPPLDVTEHVCAEIPIGDHHYGMLAWDKEAVADYDLRIADRLLRGATFQLIGQAPKCKLGVIEGLGDFEHYDSFKPITPTNANILDSDTRYPKMAEVAMDAWIIMIEAALTHFEEVWVFLVNANHDPVGQTWLRISLRRIFRDNPRVKIDPSPNDFQYWEFGKNLIGCYHGHVVKMEALPQIMAQDRPEAWGRTVYRYWRTGHVHRKNTGRIWTPAGGDYGRTLVESFRVLPPTDAWGHQRGYRSMRSMQMILLHREFGEMNRYTVPPEMLEYSPDVR